MKRKGILLDTYAFETMCWARKMDTKRVNQSERGKGEEMDGIIL